MLVFRYPQDDRTVTRLHGSFRGRKFKRIGDVAVVDPGEGYMAQWKSQFASLEIKYLR
jgi:hypothetical protein